MITVSQLYVYPIKSLGGVSLSSVNITDRGFQHDRRWMLIDDKDNFLTQRELPEMALLQVEIHAEGLRVYHTQKKHQHIHISFETKTTQRINTNIWGVPCRPLLVSEEVDNWFWDILKRKCRLVYMDDETTVVIDERYNVDNNLTSFSDGYPILMISESSLTDLNTRTGEVLEMNRFRPNLVIKNSKPYQEDTFREFIINSIHFYGVKPSARCIITTIDPQTGKKGKEPLTTLASYRSLNNKIYFGENVIAASAGVISLGDEVTVLTTKNSLFQL